MRMRKKKWAQPELDNCPFYSDQCDSLKGRWRSGFKAEQPLHVELGCGKGVSTAVMAHSNQNINYVAIDISRDVLAVASRNIRAAYGGKSVDNILLACKECTRINEAFSAEDNIERLIISFPNPWGQRERQHKRRLTHPRQLLQYRQFLADDGEIWFKTDDDGLFDDTVSYLSLCGFSIQYLTRDLHASGFAPNYVSEHERMFTDQGIKTKFLIARKAALAQAPDLFAGRHPAPELTTLCYIEKDEEYLMLHRTSRSDDINHDKWIGIGGHFEKAESPEDCLLRECREETGLTLTDYVFRGIVTFISNGSPTQYMHLFTASGFDGRVGECDEGALEWISKRALRRLPIWEGDKIFLKLIEKPCPFFSLKLRYVNDTLIGAQLNGRDMTKAEIDTYVQEN